MRLNLFADAFVICKLHDHAQLTSWLDASPHDSMLTFVRDGHGMTVVCPQRIADETALREDIQRFTEWRCFQVDGVLDFNEIGIIAELSAILERAQISVYAISSFETDYFLVMDSFVEQAAAAFESAGHVVTRLPDCG